MAVPSLAPSFLCFIFFLFFCSVLLPVRVSETVSSSSLEKPENYIVFMLKSEKPRVFSTHHDWYSSIIHKLSPLSNHSSPKLLYTYDRVAHGFAASLTPSQASQLRNNIPGVISVHPDRAHQLQTTRSSRFSGLNDNYGLWPKSDYGGEVIVGVIDSGIWPERRTQFSDQGLPPVPSTWKGRCEITNDFPANSCNRKIIGARTYYLGYEHGTGKPVNQSVEPKSPRDMIGHGTHVAYILAGSAVANASLYGYAQGLARGVAVKSRIAVYKVCWLGSCYDSDILNAMNDAVKDGVHMLSISITYSKTRDYSDDPLAIAAFGAVNHGVLVSCAAGNDGPNKNTARNVAPWILTVGASTIDREFQSVVNLGDGRTFTGTSLFSGAPTNQVSVVYAGNANSAYCHSGQLDPRTVNGKIVFCDNADRPADGTSIIDKGVAVMRAGGIGMIVPNKPIQGKELQSYADLIPTSFVTSTDGDLIRAYVRWTPSPTARIESRGTVFSLSPSAPRVAAFSSRGPNLVTPQILKPDVIAPGVNILAAWSGAIGPSITSYYQTTPDTRRTEFNVLSGTSMACPHVTGLAAMLKKVYPLWSPAAIKSAIMTTATPLDNNGRPFIDLSTGLASVPYTHGSGHVDTTSILDPGLVYDTGVSDYVDFLCTIGYNATTISKFVGTSSPPVDCSRRHLGNPGSLNYPSFSILFTPTLRTVTYRRTVKNVGTEKNTLYEVSWNISPHSVNVIVRPPLLQFTDVHIVLSYEVIFTSLTPTPDGAFGSLVWSNGPHNVTSPIAVTWQTTLYSDL